jgi:uncharacterized protein (DUF433 family)
MLIETPHTEIVPVEMNAAGIIMISGTRIPIDTVIYFHLQGDTPEQIQENFDTLNLPDIYAIITYYLRHKMELDAYLAEREKRRAALREEIEARHPELIGMRARLIARLDEKRKQESQDSEE